MVVKTRMKMPWGIAVLIFAVFIIRLLITVSSPDLNYDSYGTVRQVDAILHTGIPLYVDTLRDGNALTLFLPLFYYVLALFALILPLMLVLKLIPLLLFCVALYFIYALALRISRTESIALVIAGFAAFIPITMSFKGGTHLLNSATPLSLAFPLFLAILYFFIDVENKNRPMYVLILTFALVLTTPLAFVLVIAYLIYALLMRMESAKTANVEREIMLFTFFLAMWINLIIFKKALLVHGASVIWQNTPTSIIENYFVKISVLDSIYAVGILPLLLGIYVLYRSLAEKGSRHLLFISSVLIAFFILLWFRLISLSYGLLFLGVLLVILSAHALKLLSTYLDKTRFERYKLGFLFAIIIVFILTSALPAMISGANLSSAVPSAEETAALLWLDKNAAPHARIVSTPQEGAFVKVLSKRQSFLDDSYLLIPNIDKRYADLHVMYTSKLTSEATKRLEEYGVTHIYLSRQAQDMYAITDIPYAQETACLNLIYNKTVRIYENHCFAQVTE